MLLFSASRFGSFVALSLWMLEIALHACFDLIFVCVLGYDSLFSVPFSFTSRFLLKFPVLVISGFFSIFKLGYLIVGQNRYADCMSAG